MDNSQQTQQAVTAPAAKNHTNGKKLLERMRFPQFRHDRHGPIVDVNKVEDERLIPTCIQKRDSVGTVPCACPRVMWHPRTGTRHCPYG